MRYVKPSQRQTHDGNCCQQAVAAPTPAHGDPTEAQEGSIPVCPHQDSGAGPRTRCHPYKQGLPSRGRPMLAAAPCRAAPLCQLMLHTVMTHGQQMSQRGRLKESRLWATEWLDSRLALSDQPRHEQSHGRQPRRLVHAVERTRFGYQKALFKSGQTVFTSQRT